MSFKPYPKYKESGVEWLGRVPEHWEATSLGRFTTSKCDGPFGSGLKSEHYTDTGVRVIRLQNIRSQGFSGDDEAFIDPDYFASELTGHDVLADDLLIAGLGDDRNTVGRACVAPRGIAPAMVKADCFRFRLDRRRALPSFVAAALTAGAPADAGMMSSGSTRSRIPLSVMATRRIALPPLQEQSAVASFLDAETAKIDALIAEQQRLIELLQEKRQAVISHAVTKGLNPDAPMKDSGIEWLGEVPEHWAVIRLGHRGRLQNGLSIGGEAFGAGDPFVSYGDVYKNTVVPNTPSGLVQSTADDQHKYGLEVGDVLFTRTSESADDIGVAATCLRVIPRSTFAGFLIRFRPDPGILDPGYSKYLFRNQGVQGHFAGTMNLVTRASLSQGELRSLPICIPPIPEQVLISAALDERLEQLRVLTADTESAIALLQERRSALISAAVTGQIDVRGFSTGGGSEAA